MRGGELKKKDRFHKSCKELEVSSIKINIPKIQIGQFKEAEIGWGGSWRRGGLERKGEVGEWRREMVGWPILDPCWSDSFKSLPNSYREDQEQQCLYFKIQLHSMSST